MGIFFWKLLKNGELRQTTKEPKTETWLKEVYRVVEDYTTHHEFTTNTGETQTLTCHCGYDRQVRVPKRIKKMLVSV